MLLRISFYVVNVVPKGIASLISVCGDSLFSAVVAIENGGSDGGGKKPYIEFCDDVKVRRGAVGLALPSVYSIPLINSILDLKSKWVTFWKTIL
jgi:hypothetical protein